MSAMRHVVSAPSLGLAVLVIRAAASAAPAAASTEVSASLPADRVVRAARLSGAVSLDGSPDENAWQGAETGTAFTQTEPEEGQPSTATTRFWVLWDEEALYVAAECADPDGVTSVLSRRDRPAEGDKVEFNLDTTLDRRTAYLFTVFASGQQLDGLRFNDTEMTTEWDAAWESKAVRTGSGWSFEARIPLRVMRIPYGAREFRFNISRTIARRREESRWKFVPKGVPGEVSSLGRLVGIDGIRPVRTIELRPYLGMRTTLTRPGVSDQTAPFLFGLCSSTGVSSDMVGAICAGADARVGLTSDLALVATVNPDFGQVEVDQRVLNLTTFETFFPEKRPFFLHGMEAFQPPYNVVYSGPYGGDAYQLFYTRRIGRAPPSASLSGEQRLLYTPTSRPLDAAVKLSGSIGRATVGLLSAYESRVSASIEDADGEVSRQPLADAVHSGVATGRVAVGDHAIVGMTATAVDPLYPRPEGELLGGAAPGDPLSAANGRHSHAGALDLALFDDGRDWNLRSQVAGSAVSDGRSVVLRDGTVLGDGSTGLALSTKLSKESGAVTAMLDADYLSREFWVDDLGFMPRANLFRTLGLVALRDVHPGPRWQRAQISMGGRLAQNADRDVTLTRDGFVSSKILLNSYWELRSVIFGGPRAADDRELLDGTPFQRLGGLGGFFGFSTDGRKPVSGSFDLQHQEVIGRDARFTDAAIDVLMRPAPALDVDVALSFSRTENDVRMIRAAGPVMPDAGNPNATLDPATATSMDRLYLFAPQDARSVGLTVRGTLAFSPALTLEAYGQLFTAGVSYRDPLRAAAAPGKDLIRLDDLTPALAGDMAPDNSGQQGAVNVNLILRWEWRLGSTLYFVYAHETANFVLPTSRGLDFGGELGAIAADGASHGDTLLVKADFLYAL